MTPTARSLKFLRDSGHFAAVVEQWVPRINIRRDAFGWADVLAVHPERMGAVLIQVTTASNAAARIKKARGNGALVAWLLSGGRLVVHAWRKLKNRWTVAERELGLEDVIASHAAESSAVSRENESDPEADRALSPSLCHNRTHFPSAAGMPDSASGSPLPSPQGGAA